MFKITSAWNNDIELKVRTIIGEKAITRLLTMEEYKFYNQVTGLLQLLPLSKQEEEILELAVLSENRVRVYHTTLIILLRSLSVIEETQRIGIDQEDIDQHGLHDTSSPVTLMNERSFNNICHSCDLLNGMDLQDLIHTYTNN